MIGNLWLHWSTHGATVTYRWSEGSLMHLCFYLNITNCSMVILVYIVKSGKCKKQKFLPLIFMFQGFLQMLCSFSAFHKIKMSEDLQFSWVFLLIMNVTCIIFEFSKSQEQDCSDFLSLGNSS